jgi:hypothetical protein
MKPSKKTQKTIDVVNSILKAIEKEGFVYNLNGLNFYYKGKTFFIHQVKCGCKECKRPSKDK